MNSVYVARQNLATLLALRGYDIATLQSENEFEVDTMESTDTLNFSLTHPSNGAKVFVYFDTQTRALKKNDLGKILEEYSLGENDTLIIVAYEFPSEPFGDAIRDAYKTMGHFVQIFALKELQIDILKHRMVPNHRVLSKPEAEAIMKEYNIKDSRVMPLLDREDAVAKRIGARPGDIIEISRNSETAGGSKYYRLAVNSVAGS